MALTKPNLSNGSKPIDAPLLRLLGLDQEGSDEAENALLTQALTHRSMPDVGYGYERLEFLGDRVIGLLVAQMLLEKFPDEDEGAIAKRHTALVRKEALAEVAEEIGLGAYIRLSQGEERAGGRRNPAILSDVMEAVLAVLFRRKGLDGARALVAQYWAPRLDRDPTPPRDPKTILQEWLQSKRAPLPEYRLVSRVGPDHAPVFEIDVVTPGHGSARGAGKSKRDAEQAAAEALLRQNNVL